MSDNQNNSLGAQDMGGEAEEMQTFRLDNMDKSLYLGKSSVIGKRKSQQDSIATDDEYCYYETGRLLAVLCDGMGGLKGGEQASGLSVAYLLNLFHSPGALDNGVASFYQMAVKAADSGVCALTDEQGVSLQAGTTLASVMVDDDKLHWASVGDSHIYICRGDDIVCVTRDHNYFMLLKQKAENGEITMEEAETNPRREALVSYIGMGGVKYIDVNLKPFQLMDGDAVLLCSDGLYRTIGEEEMKTIIQACGDDTARAAEALTALAISKDKPHQDNTSVIVIRYRVNS